MILTTRVNDIAETLSNPTGGMRQLTIYQGLLRASLNLDLEKIATWPGASFYVDGYQISGRGLSKNAIGNLLAVSTIEGLASTRLHDLWLQQEFLDGRASFRLGQIALDDEFYVSQYSAIFVNSTFGCPDLLSTNLPSGGPCYPFAVPGVRVRAAPTTGLTFSAAAFNGNPAPPRTRRSANSQPDRHQFPDRRGWLSGDCGNGLCIRYGADFFSPAERCQTRWLVPYGRFSRFAARHSRALVGGPGQQRH